MLTSLNKILKIAEAILQKRHTQFHDVVSDATQAIQDDVKEAMRIFSMR